jgi:hypothetical protein
MANIQKQAGRLGVMKAIDELQDNAYYANVEGVKVTGVLPELPQSPQSTNLLNKFKRN